MSISTSKLSAWKSTLLYNMLSVSTENDKFATSHSITLGVNGSSLETAYNIMHNPKKVEFLESKGYVFNPSKSGDKVIFKITKLYSYNTDEEFAKRLDGVDLSACDEANLTYVRRIFGNGELVHDREPQTRIIKEELGLVKKSEAKTKASDEAFATAARGMMSLGMVNPLTSKPFATIEEAIQVIKNAQTIKEQSN
jgi:phage pi2 protein 07